MSATSPPAYVTANARHSNESANRCVSVTLFAVLESVSDKLVIYLATVATFDVAGTQLVVPQRVDPAQTTVRPTLSPSSGTASEGRLVDGRGDFENTITDAAAELRPLLQRLTAWAKGLEHDGLVKLWTYHGKAGIVIVTLLPRLHAENVGLVTIYNDLSLNAAYLQFWRSVITRRAPSSLARLEALAAPAKIGQGTTTRTISDELLEALSDAYREAATGPVKLDVQVDHQST